MRVPALLAGAALTATLVVAAPAWAISIGTQGCTPEYWKNHASNWQEYITGSKLGFNGTIPDSLAALSFQGGPGIDGATQILFRAPVAAHLNAAHDGIGYPCRRFAEPGSIQSAANAALTSGSRQKTIDTASWLDTPNNLGCPLN